MGIKLGKLVESIDTMEILNNQKGMGSVTAYRVMKNWDAVIHELQYFDKQKAVIIEKYGEKDEDGKLIVNEGKCKILNEHTEKYAKELEELLNEEVELSIKAIPLSSLDSVGLSPVQMATIEFMIEE